MAGGRPGDNGHARLLPALAAALLVLCLIPRATHAQIPPDAEWRTLRTEHFDVTYPAGLDSLGARTAAIAESAYEGLAAGLADPPRGRTHVLLTDFTDVSNAFASTAPYRRVVIYARPPIDGTALSYTDEWLETVIVHELAHVFHLDTTGPIGRALRSVFGAAFSP